MPFFKWYPAEAEADSFFRSLTLEERGLFITCLNLCWVNGGLPTDLHKMASILKINPRTLRKLWPRIEAKFPRIQPPFPKLEAQFQNIRLESQRNSIATKSLKASESAKARYERSATPAENAGEIQIQIQRKKQIQIQTQSDDAREFAEQFPDQSNQNATVQEYLSLVGPSEKAAVFECLKRYKASEQVSRGVLQSGRNWLMAQKANNWNGQWAVPKKGPQRLTEAEEIAQLERWKAEDEEQQRRFYGRRNGR